MTLSTGLSTALADAVTDVRTRATDRLAYAHDASHFVLTPQAVVVPRDAAEVGRLALMPARRRSRSTSCTAAATRPRHARPGSRTGP